VVLDGGTRTVVVTVTTDSSTPVDVGVVLDGGTRTVVVTVTTDSSTPVDVGVIESVDVAVPELVVPFNVEDVDAGFIVELPDPGSDPVIPPVAPAASMRERAFFSLVQVIVVPLELSDGSAKQCWVGGQPP